VFVLQNKSADFDGPWLLVLGPWQEEREKTVTVLCLDAIWVELNRKGYCAVKLSKDAFAAMHAALGVGQNPFA
jgi:hypothetical protein